MIKGRKKLSNELRGTMLLCCLIMKYESSCFHHDCCEDMPRQCICHLSILGVN